MERILDCKIFEDYTNKKYKVSVKHKIFGTYEMQCVINELIDTDKKIGFIVHGKEIFCYKQDKEFDLTEEKDSVFMSDSLMEIVVENI